MGRLSPAYNEGRSRMNPVSRTFGRSSRVAAVIAVAALTLLVPAGRAQTPVSHAETESEVHPAHIHSGTCDQLGDVVYPLADVAAPTGEEMGTAGGHMVKISEANHIDAPLQDLLDGEYAINVHLSAEEIGTYIACGNIGGIVNDMENGGGKELVIGLAELNDSGHVGIAWLGDDGKGGTNVTVSLIEPEEME
jgi:hypothetical protein